MPRRKITERRAIEPDPRYNSALVSKFTNGIMERGKKSNAQKIFYGAMDIIEQQVKDAEPITVFDKAMEMVRPKVGSQVPACWWCNLPGTSRSTAGTQKCFGNQVDNQFCQGPPGQDNVRKTGGGTPRCL